MPLVVELKPNERVIIGDTLIKNGSHRAKFTIQGDAPVLRERDILPPDAAMSPSKRIYMTVQMIYLENDFEKYADQLQEFMSDYGQAAPSSLGLLSDLSHQILSENLYTALKIAKKLIKHEEELLGHASGSNSLRPDGQNDSSSS